MSAGVCCGITVTGEADERGRIVVCDVCDEWVTMLIDECPLCDGPMESTPYPAICPRCESTAVAAGRYENERIRTERDYLERWMRK